MSGSEHRLSISNDPSYLTATITATILRFRDGLYNLVCGLENAMQVLGTYDDLDA
jgi:hypothetical protein